jgi:hypothetical protein
MYDLIPGIETIKKNFSRIVQLQRDLQRRVQRPGVNAIPLVFLRF